MIIFVHIPKTGGTTLFRSLSNGGAEIHRSHEPAYRIKPTYLSWDTEVRATLIRNPWDRAVSWYYWQDIERITSLGFGEWIRAGCPSDPALGVDPMDQLQYFTCPETGKDLVKHVGRYERLELFTSFLGETVAVKPADLGHYQKSCRPSVPYQELYTRETAEMLADHTREFIERFNYDFDD